MQAYFDVEVTIRSSLDQRIKGLFLVFLVSYIFITSFTPYLNQPCSSFQFFPLCKICLKLPLDWTQKLVQQYPMMTQCSNNTFIYFYILCSIFLHFHNFFFIYYLFILCQFNHNLLLGNVSYFLCYGQIIIKTSFCWDLLGS